MYGARSAGESRRRYDQWAPQYEQDLVDTYGYRLPDTIAEDFARWVTPHATVLDAGVGTGLVGACLADLGFRDLVGLDNSPAMLAESARKGVYRALHEMTLGQPLGSSPPSSTRSSPPAPSPRVTLRPPGCGSSGLSAKQLAALCLPSTPLAMFRLLDVRCRYAFVGGPCEERRCRRIPRRRFTDRPPARVTRPGGHVVVGIRPDIIESHGFAEIIDELAATRVWVVVDRTEPRVATEKLESYVRVETWCFRIL